MLKWLHVILFFFTVWCQWQREIKVVGRHTGTVEPFRLQMPIIQPAVTRHLGRAEGVVHH
jgi:hypothetical protein